MPILEKLTDRYVFRYRKEADHSPSTEGEKVDKPRSLGSTNRRYLHDHRTKDSLIEYLDNLEQ